MMETWLLTLCLFLSQGMADDRTTLYAHYTDKHPASVTSGLVAANKDEFLLNGKPFKILGGEFHYFRVHPLHWRRRLRQYKAAGLNTVIVYVPWNLHEPKEAIFDFGIGDNDNDFSDFLNLNKVLRMIRHEDMFVILRPGPYICGEWEFGGLPSWLLSYSQDGILVRTSTEPYWSRALRYLRKLANKVYYLQFHSTVRKGGPIIAVQIENEYGGFQYDGYPGDKQYLRLIKDTLTANGIESMFFTSDNIMRDRDHGSLPYEGIFMASNFQTNTSGQFQALREFQPNKPLMIAEFWTGWFDHWFEGKHNSHPIDEIEKALELVERESASISFYMFHGGTNFGFMNGGNILAGTADSNFIFAPTVTSYDYDAPLSENGGYTKKYDAIANFILKYDPLISQLIIPERPDYVPPTKYGDVNFDQQLSFSSLVSNVNPNDIITRSEPVSMEAIGQDYGYIVYRKSLPNLKTGDVLTIRGRVHDLASVLVNRKLVSDPILKKDDVLNKFGGWAHEDGHFIFDLDSIDKIDGGYTLEILVENLGRASYGKPHTFDQRKGIWEDAVLLNGQKLNDWEHIPLQFNKKWMNSLTGWEPYTTPDPISLEDPKSLTPRVLKGNLVVEKDDLVTSLNGTEQYPKDTFVDLSGDWLHGLVFVNGFGLGRYFQAGPQETLYLPGPLLTLGSNEIIVVQTYYSGQKKLSLTTTPKLG